MKIWKVIKRGWAEDRKRIGKVDWSVLAGWVCEAGEAIVGAIMCLALSVAGPLAFIGLLLKPVLVTWWWEPSSALWQRRRCRKMIESGEWARRCRNGEAWVALARRDIGKRLAIFPDDPTYTAMLAALDKAPKPAG